MRRSIHHLGAASIAALQLASCAEDLTAAPADEQGRPVVTEDMADGEFITRIDASSSDAWVYFSFDTGAEALPADPADSADWDLGFQRFHVISNGGVSGRGGAAIAIAGGSFAEVASAPAGDYVEDAADSDDDDVVVDSAFAADGGWYDYDPATNRLSPKPLVYVIRASGGSHYKLQIVDYYDAAGSSGHPSFVWAELD